MKITRNEFTYYFNDLAFMGSMSVYANGEADVSYRIAPKEPDIGIMEPYPTDIEILRISIEGHKDHHSSVNLEQTHWLFKAIESYLVDSENVADECMENAMEWED